MDDAETTRAPAVKSESTAYKIVQETRWFFELSRQSCVDMVSKESKSAFHRVFFQKTTFKNVWGIYQSVARARFVPPFNNSTDAFLRDMPWGTVGQFSLFRFLNGVPGLPSFGYNMRCE
jgi:hypothetical protein